MFQVGDFVIGKTNNTYPITCTNSVCVVVDRHMPCNGAIRDVHIGINESPSMFVVRIDSLSNGDVLTPDRTLSSPHGSIAFEVNQQQFVRASRPLASFYLRHKLPDLIDTLGQELVDIIIGREDVYHRELTSITTHPDDIIVDTNETFDNQQTRTATTRVHIPIEFEDFIPDDYFLDADDVGYKPNGATAKEPPKHTCEFCGKEFDCRDLSEVEDDNGDYCHMLCPECKALSRRLRHWSRLTPKFSNRIGRGHDLHIGFELEVDDGEDYMRTIYDIKKLMGDTVYCERDGSLGRSGIEIISMPMNYDAYTKAPLKDLFQVCLNHGYRSHNTTTCGLHFHCDRRFVDENAVRRLEWFITKYYETVIFNVSRRSSMMNMEQWANVSKALKADTELHSIKTRLNKIKDVYEYGHYDNDHHFAFNKENHNTVEFRFFRGTLNYDTFMMSYKFVYELCLIAKELTDEQAFTLTNWTNKMSADVRKFIEMKGRRVVFDKDFPICHIKNKKYNKIVEEGEL